MVVSSGRSQRVLILSPFFPSAVDPASGTFVRAQAQALTDLGLQISLAAPVPWAPPHPQPQAALAELQTDRGPRRISSRTKFSDRPTSVHPVHGCRYTQGAMPPEPSHARSTGGDVDLIAGTCPVTDGTRSAPPQSQMEQAVRGHCPRQRRLQGPAAIEAPSSRLSASRPRSR